MPCPVKAVVAAICTAMALGVVSEAQADTSANLSSIDVRLVNVQRSQPQAALNVIAQGGRVIVSVNGGTGIGRATVSRLEARWPLPVVLRLHLQGLERLKVDAGKSSFYWSLPSTGAGHTIMSVTHANVRRRVRRSDPGFAGLTLVGPKPTIPLVDGHFELVLPSAVFADNPRAVTIQWVDFFR